MSDRPTPETDAAWEAYQKDHLDGDPWGLCSDLERRLAECREALRPIAEYESIRKTMGGTTPKSGSLLGVGSRNGEAEITVEDMQRCIDALANTAPKP